MKGFGDAMAAMRDGQFVRRPAWYFYLAMISEPDVRNIPKAIRRSAADVVVQPCILQVDPAINPYREVVCVELGWRPTSDDIRATDWVLCDDLGRAFAP